MPPKRLRSFPEVPLILSANRFRTGASYFPKSSAKIQQKNDISKFLPSEMSLNIEKLNFLFHLLLFRLLQSLQSIWQLSGVVCPPCDQGVIWSASISSISKCLPQIGQIPFCFSY